MLQGITFAHYSGRARNKSDPRLVARTYPFHTSDELRIQHCQIMLATAALFATALLSAPAQDLTLPPETASTVAILEGRGVQIYTCAANLRGYSWMFKAPEAQLINLATGKPAGHHDAGPSWTLDDGSSVRGTVLGNRLANNPADVPWLLLGATPTPAATGQTDAPHGMLADVTYVRRYNTHGGAAPATGCDRSQIGQTLRVPYTATYAFYATPGTHSDLQTAPSTPAPAPPPAVPPPPPPPPPQ